MINHRRFKTPPPFYGTGAAEQKKYSVFANASYKQQPMSYLVNNGQQGWVRYAPLSNADTMTFVNMGERAVIMSFRGTVWTNAADIFQNIGILTGSSLFKQRERANLGLYDAVAKTFPGYTITLTGHSAGGYQAMALSGKRGARAVVFNAAATPGDLKMLRGNVQHYSTTNLASGDIDFVSLANPAPTETVAVKIKGDAHTIKNFLPEGHVDGKGLTRSGARSQRGRRGRQRLVSRFQRARE